MLLTAGSTIKISVPSGTSERPMPSVYTFPLLEILVGVLLESSAVPPLIENVKSEASKSPIPK